MNIELIEPETATEPQDIAEIRDGAAVVKLNRTEAGLLQLRTELAGKVYDLTTVKGDKEARNDRLRCVGLRANVEKLRKSLKAPALEFGRLIDSEAKRITEAVESLEAPIDAAIKADEARREEERQAKARAEAARLAGLRDAVAAALGKWVARCQDEGITAERIAAGIDMLGDLSANPEWQEVNDFWQSTKAQTLAAMRGLHDAAKRREEAARLEAQRAEQERQAAIQRQQAAELARQRAELEAQAQALRDQAAQLQREKDAEAQRIAAAEQRQQAAAEAAAQAQAAQVTEPQPPQQVLKATPATADATDRGIAAIVSPGVGPMGAGQPADAGPTGGNVGRLQPAANEPATLTLGMICERLQFTVRADFLADVLHVSPARVEGKRPGTYTESQFQTICSQLQSHISAMGELYSPEKAA